MHAQNFNINESMTNSLISDENPISIHLVNDKL